MPDPLDVYEARLLVCRLHAHRLRDRAINNRDTESEAASIERLNYLHDLAFKTQIADSTDKLTAQERSSIDAWYAQAKQEGRIVGAAPV